MSIECRKCKEKDILKLSLNQTVFLKKTNMWANYYYCRECNYSRRSKYNKEHSENINVNINNSHKKYPQKQKSRRAIAYRVKIGVILKTPCIQCGNNNVQAHHSDYSRPLEISWLCVSCHADLHKKINTINI